MNILVVCAHPDDEIFGIGGTIAKHTSKGDKVYTLILGEGKTSRGATEKQELDELKKESLEANKVLGVKEVFFEDLPDNKFDSVPLLDIIKKVESYIEKIDPEIVYTHYGDDLNIDHKLIFQAVLTAARPLPGSRIKLLAVFETLSSTEWAEDEKTFVPNFYSEISNNLDKKLDAMSKYKSELREFPHPRSLEGIKILAKKRGVEAGVKAVEALKIIREIEG